MAPQALSRGLRLPLSGRSSPLLRIGPPAELADIEACRSVCLVPLELHLYYFLFSKILQSLVLHAQLSYKNFSMYASISRATHSTPTENRVGQLNAYLAYTLVS